MPARSRRPCAAFPCPLPAVPKSARCAEHTRKLDAERGTRTERGYSNEWSRSRAAFLRLNPACAEHLKRGDFARATVVDHVEPHRGDQRLFWDRSNWQPLCAQCHGRKTQAETLTRRT